MRNIKICVITILFFIVSYVDARSQILDVVQKKLETFRQTHLQEKIYVHTDKNFYIAGEIAWFKIYDVDAGFHTPLDVSKVAYIEMLDNNNKPLIQAKIALSQGMGNGSLYIPVVINTGNYKLRAYTNWMKNYEPDYFFEKMISVVNSQKVYEMPARQAPAQYDMQFFPEGGNLVQNMQSTVGFKVTDQNGKGIEFSGAIVADNKDTVARFKPLKFGIGSFTITPAPDHYYKAVLQPLNAPAIVKEFRQVFKEGYVMTMKEVDNNQLSIHVQCNITGQTEVYFLAHTRQSVKIAEAGKITDGGTTFLVNKNQLSDGISHFTIFNSARQPVCERLYFKPPVHKLQLAVNTDQPIYASRKKVTVNINSGAQDKKGAEADLSLAVYRLDSLQALDESDINSYLWLVSDLKGSIESPGYYLNNPATETAKAMDNLMLTQGWRRFRWNDLMKDTAPFFEYPPEYKGHIISGKIVDTKTGSTAKDITGYLSVPGTRSLFSPVISDYNGRVNFEMRGMYGSSEIILQTNPREDSMYKIEIINPFSEKYTTGKLPPYLLTENNLGNLLDQSVGMQVQNIFTGEKMQRFFFRDNDTSAFYRNADLKYQLDDYVRFTTMEEVLREYVILVNVRKKQGRYHLSTYDEPGKKLFENDPLMLLDGIPIFDIDKFIAYDPMKVRKLEVMLRKYFLGSSNFDGILNWSTYKGDFNSYELDPHALALDYEGLQLQREFYSPAYETMNQVASHLPDFRSVLYWAPDIITGKEGSKQLSFYTSDVPGKYAIVLQGITKEGISGSTMGMFEVKE